MQRTPKRRLRERGGTNQHRVGECRHRRRHPHRRLCQVRCMQIDVEVYRHARKRPFVVEVMATSKDATHYLQLQLRRTWTPTNVRSRRRHRATGAGERRITTTVCSASLCDYHARESSVDRGAEISLCAIHSSAHTIVQCRELCHRNTSTVVRRSPACRTVTRLRDVVARCTSKQQWKKRRI